MKNGFYALPAAAMLALSSNVMAVDIGHGKTLQQKNCMACHDDGMYTRDNRKISSLDALRKQVKRCEFSLELQWFDEDVNDVAGYLNESFYKFK